LNKSVSFTLKSRTRFLLHFIGVIFFIVLLRIFGLQIIRYTYYKKLAEKNIIKVVHLPQKRGEILDRNGIVIASSIPDYNLKVYPYLINHNKEVIQLLSEISFISENTIRKKVKNSKSFYYPVVLQKHLTVAEVATIVERITDLPGVNVERKPLRDYRFGVVASHLIGFTGEVTETELKSRTDLKEGDFIGKSGLEKFYDSFIRGKPGFEYIEVDAKGREIGLFEDLKALEPEPGANIQLTIDILLQELADSLLADYASGSVVAINPKNGEVLVLYSKPGFDPNILTKGISFEGLQNLVYTQNSSFWNRATMSAYPPGSVFKIMIVALALENGIIEPTTKLRTCLGSLRIGNRIFNCWKEHGSLNTHKAVVQSCDVFFYQVGMRLGFAELEKGVRKLQLFEKTGIDIPEERGGFFPNREWYKKRSNVSFPTKGMVANLSIGQGEVLMTPIEVCFFFSAIANKGYSFTPHLVNVIQHVSGATLFRPDREKRTLQLSEQTISFIRNALLCVVNERGGTGALSKIEGCKIAGKTGTAENPMGDDHAWFVAFAPFEEPEICVVVMVENAGHGGAVAAPIAREIIKKALNINPYNENE